MSRTSCVLLHAFATSSRVSLNLNLQRGFQVDQFLNEPLYLSFQHTATPTRQTDEAKLIARIRQTTFTGSTVSVMDRWLDTDFVSLL